MAIGAGAVLAFLLPLVWGNQVGWPRWIFLCMAGAILLFLAFVIHERRTERRGGSPLVPPALFGLPGVTGGVLVAAVFFAGTSYLFVLTLYLQEGLGYSPLHAALTFLPGSLGIVAGSAVGVPLAPKLGRRIVWISSGAMIAALGLLIVSIRSAGAALTSWQLAPGILLAGFAASSLVGTVTVITAAASRFPLARAAPKKITLMDSAASIL